MDDDTARRQPRPREPNPRAWQPAAGTGISRAAIAVAAAVILLLLLGGGWYWWQQRSTLPPLLPPAPAEPVATAPAAPAPAPAPAIQHPIDEAPPTAAASAPAPLTLDNADPVVNNALVELLGSKPVATMLRTDDFVRRAVATIDNLGRSHAAPRLWPVAPVAGRFSVQAADGGEQIAPANAQRYDAFVGFATAVDGKRSAALYRRFYPLFQRAYQELGYPQSYFNDRLVAVIDQMLATPELATPPSVRLTEVKGPIAPGAADRPWTRYEFTDPALEALPAGSKMLLRMGPQHAARLKAQLRAFRAEIARK